MSDNQLHDTAERFLERLRKAWDAGDARDYAAQFTADATYVIFLGEALIGREEIEQNHIDVFGRWQKGTKMAVKAIGVRSLGRDVCSVLTIGGIGKKASIGYDKLQTFTLVRVGGQWLCASFQNTRMSHRAMSSYDKDRTPPEDL